MASCYSVLKKLQLGPTVKLSLTVTRPASDCSKMATGSTNIDNLALIIITMEGMDDSNNLQIGIIMKKIEGAKNLLVSMTIVCDEIKEQLLCTNTCVEKLIKVISPDRSVAPPYYNQKHFLYSFEVSITIQTIEGPTPMSTQSMVMTHLHENTEFTDFQLKATDGAIPVHKAILTSHSDMFKTMLQCDDWTETKESCITMKDVTVKNLHDLKAYMYLGILPDTDLDSLLVLLLMASYYLMDRLKSQCIAKLVKTVKPKDLKNLIDFACQNNMPDLVKEILLRIPDHTVTSAYQSDKEEQISKNK